MTIGATRQGEVLLDGCSAPVDALDVARLLDRMGLCALDDGDDAAMPRIRFGDVAIAVAVEGSATDARNASRQATGTRPPKGSGDDALAIGAVGTDAPRAGDWLSLSLACDTDPGPERLEAALALLSAATIVGGLIDARRVYWAPARLYSPVGDLLGAMNAMHDGGPPPVLHMVAFVSGERAVCTRGLAYFCDVELSMPLDHGLPAHEATRRLARLAVHAMVVGPMERGAAVAGLVDDEVLTIGGSDMVDGVRVITVHQRWRR